MSFIPYIIVTIYVLCVTYMIFYKIIEYYLKRKNAKRLRENNRKP